METYSLNGPLLGQGITSWEKQQPESKSLRQARADTPTLHERLRDDENSIFRKITLVSDKESCDCWKHYSAFSFNESISYFDGPCPRNNNRIILQQAGLALPSPRQEIACPQMQ